ncbi:MAG: hypothetical protein K2X80_01995 [Pseudomonadaceae bacterium]|jgi:hypothetical protein|nr:hypothetical protein [Pseudomonadaceae bacterium]
MNLPTTSTATSRTTLTRQAMFGGAIIDAQGREIAITESMIQRACHELAKTYVAAQKKA